jgi:uncharacterized membrane protein YqjE
VRARSRLCPDGFTLAPADRAAPTGLAGGRRWILAAVFSCALLAHSPAQPALAMTTDTHSQRHEHGPLRRLLGSAFAMLQTRLELIGIELAEEKDRLIGVLFLGLAAMMLALLALIALTALVAIAFWDTWRWQALACITLIYATGAIVCTLKARNGLRNAPPVFQATLEEFEKDREILRKP